MSNAEHPLAPTLLALFEGHTLESSCACDSRTLFYQLLHQRSQAKIQLTAYAFVQQQLQQLQISALNAAYHPANCSQALNAQLTPLKPNTKALLSATPVLYTELAWLDHCVPASCNQEPLALELQAFALTIEQTSKTERLRAYADILPDLHTWAFSQRQDIPLAFFDFAALQLALGLFPRVLFAEILGFTYAHCQSNGLGAGIGRTTNANWQAQLPLLLDILQRYIASFPAVATSLWQRFQQGYWLYYGHLSACQQQLNEACTAATTEQQLIEVLLHLRSSAVGHHHAITLEGKSLDDWFSETPFRASDFLMALRHSAYVDAQQPTNSRLLKLFAFKGPMFGVLNTQELALLQRWLAAPNNNTATMPLTETHAQPSALAQRVPLHQRAPEPSLPNPRQQLNSRTWYYTLANIDLFPSALAPAKQRVQRLVTLTKLCNRLPFSLYSHQAFANFIQARYQQELNAYRPLTTKPRIAKATYIWAIEQLAPAILTDGCWLQQIARLKYQPTQAVGALLTKIYRDELGDGQLLQNHPFIYQQLLTSVGITLPPIHTQAFSQHPGFIDSAFAIPNYLLAISHFPESFLPELLGLNMAIELSGLGKDYLRLAQALNYYGLDSTIVNVHISIDNLASGHAALAQQTIQRYLDEVLATAGETVMQQQWRRIYTGFCSLAFVSRPFSVALVARGLLRGLTSNLNRHACTHLPAGQP